MKEILMSSVSSFVSIAISEHGGTGGRLVTESTFKDFMMIVDIVREYLDYKMLIFGFKLSILDVSRFCIAALICIDTVVGIFAGKVGD